MAAAWNDELPASGGLNECAALVRSAEALAVSAPELAVQLARRALLVGASDSARITNAGEASSLTMRAQAVLAAGLVRISQHIPAVEPGFTALSLAEGSGAAEIAEAVRLDLAACAREVGEPLLGGALLRPVLEGAYVRPSVRAAALGSLVGCVAHVARRDDVEDALAEADRLLAADDGLSPDARRMERAWLNARTAAYHRWYGDTEDAVTAARDGLALLSRLRRELRAESDRVRAQLVLELVCALLDEGELREAAEVATPTVDEPVRATSAAAVAQLMLALATRVCLPGGQVDRGRSLLDQAVWIAERHGLDSVLADAQTEVSRLDERAGRTANALEALRSARAAEQRRLRAVARAARIVLTEVGAGQGAKDITKKTMTALLRQLAHPGGAPYAVAPALSPSPLPPPRPTPEPPPARTDAGELAGSVDTDKGTGLLNREGLFRRLRSVGTGERPVALTLVRFEQNGDVQKKRRDSDRGPDTGIMAELADRVRDMAPENAELARSDGRELAVLLPHTTRDEAEELAATIRESGLADANGKDVSLSTGVVESSATTHGHDNPVDAAGLLTAARDALTQPPRPTDAVRSTAAALHSALSDETPTSSRPTPRSALSEDSPTTPLNVAKASQSLTVGRSILSSLTIPTGSGGKRRAGGDPPPPLTTNTWPTPATPQPTNQNEPTPPATPEPPAATGWPAEPDTSERLRTPGAPAHHRIPAPTDPNQRGTTGTSVDKNTVNASTLGLPGTRRRADRRQAAEASGIPATAYTTGSTDSAGATGTHSPQELTATPDTHNPAATHSAPGSTNPQNTPGATSTPGTTGVTATHSALAALGTTGTPGTHATADSAGAGAAENPPKATADTPSAASTSDTSSPSTADLTAANTPQPIGSAESATPNTPVASHLAESTPTTGRRRRAREEADAGERSPRNTYEETRAELARMMSALSPDKPSADKPSADKPTDGSTPDGMAPRQSIPTPPDPDELPEPPGRPDIPQPPEPEPIPPTPPDPGPIRPDETGPPPPVADPGDTAPADGGTPVPDWRSVFDIPAATRALADATESPNHSGPRTAGATTTQDKTDWRPTPQASPSAEPGHEGGPTQQNEADWRSRLSTSPSEEPRNEGTTEQDKPDWRSAFPTARSEEPGTDTAGAGQDKSDWRSALPASPSTEPRNEGTAGQGTPDWRSTFPASSSAEPRNEDTTEQGTPDWRSAFPTARSGESGNDAAAAGQDKSDWRSAFPTSPSEEPRNEGATVGQGTPDWRSALPTARSGESGNDAAAAGEDKSDWRSAFPTSLSAESRSDGATAGQGTPDWRSAFPTARSEESGTDTAAAGQDKSDWRPVLPTSPPAEPRNDTATVQQETADWRSALPVSPSEEPRNEGATAGQDTPDWRSALPASPTAVPRNEAAAGQDKSDRQSASPTSPAESQNDTAATQQDTSDWRSALPTPPPAELPKRTRSQAWSSAFETPFASPDRPSESPSFSAFGAEPAPQGERRVDALSSAFGVKDQKDQKDPKNANDAKAPSAQQPEELLGPIQGPENRPEGPPPRRERSSTTIASLLAEALAAYQATDEASEDRDTAPEPSTPAPLDTFGEFDRLLDQHQQSGVPGRHRSPE